jgi:endoglucanase
MRASGAIPGLAALVWALAPASAPAAPPNVIRTGGPSGAGDSKIAVVAASRPLSGKRFSVVDSAGRTVARGRLRKAPGSPRPWRYAATADLSAVASPGRYRVKAIGLTSRRWVVDPGARSRLIRRLLRLFAVNSDGTEPNPVFGPAHLNDAIVKGGPLDGQRIDLTGGWRDAGDNLKIAQPAAFAVAYLNLAARLAPADAAALHAAGDVGARWLLKAHPRPDLFIVLVGDSRDHVGFRDPARDDTDTRDGVGIRYAYPSTSSNVAGMVAGALALTAARSEGASRDGLIAAARDWYAAGKATNAITKIDDPYVRDFYPDDIFTDDLAFAALELYRATGDPQLLAEAAAFFRRGDDDRQLYAGTVTGAIGPIVAADLCGGLGAPPVPDEGARRLGCEGLGKVVGAGRERARSTPFGTPGIITFGSLQDNGGAGAVAAAAKRTGVARDGARLAAGARDYLLGRNAWGARFVVGPGRGDAQHPHHPAYLKGSPVRLLDGAVVNGPADPPTLSTEVPPLRLARSPFRRFNAPSIVYEDRRADYVTSEPALSTAASSVLLVASLGA